MNVELLIKELGTNLGINDLALDAQFSCSLAANDNIITLQYQPMDETLLLFAPVLFREKGFSVQEMEYALDANFLGKRTLGMHLGLSIPAGALVLSYSHPVQELTVQHLEDLLSFFAAQLSEWKTRFTQLENDNKENSDTMISQVTEAENNPQLSINNMLRI